MIALVRPAMLFGFDEMSHDFDTDHLSVCSCCSSFVGSSSADGRSSVRVSPVIGAQGWRPGLASILRAPIYRSRPGERNRRRWPDCLMVDATSVNATSIA